MPSAENMVAYARFACGIPVMTTYDPDELSRVIMLLYGKMDHGGPFWCYVAVKPSQYDAFKAAEANGSVDLYAFDEFGEVVVSAEGEQPPDEVTEKVANMYGADASTFFQPIDPIAEINKKIAAMEGRPSRTTEATDDAPPTAVVSGWAARTSSRYSR